ncbi:MAG: Na+ dependent nucleoside transporter domain protein, partial [Verrucomicrobiales bacterium]|nr:Na+ dependent nucleoside transporter domain protein [Verrucomicrobiales bacterium]
MSLIGLVAFITLAWAISLRRDKFPWRTVISGMGLQVTIAAILIPDTAFGRAVYKIADQTAQNILAFAREGTHLVFGALSENKMMQETFAQPDALVLGVTICGTIILVAVISSLLYHLRILQKIVQGMAWVMQRIMRTSGSESL